MVISHIVLIVLFLLLFLCCFRFLTAKRLGKTSPQIFFWGGLFFVSFLFFVCFVGFF